MLDTIQKSQIHIKIGFIVIKDKGGTHAYKQKSPIHIKNGFIIIIKGQGATMLISRKVQFL